MKNIKKIGVVGADQRLIAAGEKLAKEGYEICFFGGIKSRKCENTSTLSACCEGANALMLPLPYSRDKIRLNCPEGGCAISLAAIIKTAEPRCVIFGGCLDDKFCLSAEEKRIKTLDYYRSERQQILNTLSTCEGAVATALSATGKTLAFSSVFVCGYGRIGSLLSDKLSLLGAEVFLVSRNEISLAQAKIRGINPIRLCDLENKINRADIILNTVPDIIINKKEIDNMNADCAYIELASSPGGVEREYLEKKKIKYISALGLPSVYAPVSAGEIIADCIKDFIKEEEIV